jgi:1L-myo-inositol 1-phosphate cytidylyltransferase / CDP-L-myo-inositol myo-inositolphosphotransferase
MNVANRVPMMPSPMQGDQQEEHDRPFAAAAPAGNQSGVPVTGVILAAGRGTRLGVASKPLAVVGGVTLLERAVAALTVAGIDRVVVVVDSLDGPVASCCRRRLPHVEVVCAYDCARGNGATVLAGLAYAGGRCVVTMVDHLHEPATVRRLLEATGELVFAVDARAELVDREEATLVRYENGAVAAIDKQIGRHDAVEAGLAVCSAQALVEVGRRLEGELTFNRLKSAWLEAGRPIETVSIDGAFWADVDTPEDRRRAIAELVRRHGAKPTDGPVARVLNRPLSTRVSRRLLTVRIDPSAVTLANLALLLLAATLLALGRRHDALLVAGGVLVELASALDGVDGELARVSGRSSPFGAVLDAVCDRYGDLAVLVGAAIAAHGRAAWPWALAAVVANWQLSFLRREHERMAGALPASHLRWQWSRDVRMLVLAVSCVTLHPLWGLVACAVVGNLDALRRLTALLRTSRSFSRS